MFDAFVGEVTCPCCRNNSGENTEIMQTRLRYVADGSSLRIGWAFEQGELELENVLGSEYVLVAVPPSPSLIRLADTWICAACRVESWAVVEIEHLRIVRFTALVMSRAALETLHYLSDIQAEFLAMSLTKKAGLSIEVRPASVVEILRQHLP